jgi:hypothetical protein
MHIAAIDYTTGIVTYVSGDFVMPVQEDWDVIPTLKIGDAA